jgi:hypothetical protein
LASASSGDDRLSKKATSAPITSGELSSIGRYMPSAKASAETPQRDGRRAPDRLPVLIAAHLEALAQARAGHDVPVFLAGKSMSGRSLLVRKPALAGQGKTQADVDAEILAAVAGFVATAAGWKASASPQRCPSA